MNYLAVSCIGLCKKYSIARSLPAMEWLMEGQMARSRQIDILAITVVVDLTLIGCRGARNNIGVWWLREACQYRVYVVAREGVPDDLIAVLERQRRRCWGYHRSYDGAVCRQIESHGLSALLLKCHVLLLMLQSMLI
jgi:hypothetical protein